MIEAGDDVVSPASAQTLRILSFAMGGGLTMMSGLVLWTYFNAAEKAVDPRAVRFINGATLVAMIGALVLIVASEAAWRQLLRRTPGALSGRVQTAFIVRLACREGAGLFGMTVAYLAALNGVLRAYPAYWVALAPFGLFLVFLATHWPSAEGLTAEARGVLGENPLFPKK